MQPFSALPELFTVVSLTGGRAGDVCCGAGGVSAGLRCLQPRSAVQEAPGVL